jgi:hypothetical protein
VAVQASAAEMRIRAVAYARRSAGLVEEGADEIAAQSKEPAVRRAALRWKLHMIPMIHDAALQQDPLIAVADLWTLALQMEAYFSLGAGGDMFGAHQPIAIATCHEITLSGEDVIRAAVRGAGIEAPRAAVSKFAEEHPIRSRTLRRESITIAFADRLFADSKSTFATVSDVEQTARDIDYRLGFMSESMLKQARWTVELALDDAVQRVDVDDAMILLQQTLDRLDIIADELPRLVEQQRDALFAAVAAEREATFVSIDAQRVDTLRSLTAEREALFAGVANERAQIHAMIRGEREAAVADLEGVVERSLEKVVDHAFWRLLQIAIAAAVVAIPAAWVISRNGRASV